MNLKLCMGAVYCFHSADLRNFCPYVRVSIGHERDSSDENESFIRGLTFMLSVVIDSDGMLVFRKVHDVAATAEHVLLESIFELKGLKTSG